MSEREPTRRGVLAVAAAMAADLILPAPAEARKRSVPEKIADASDLPPFDPRYKNVRDELTTYQRRLRDPDTIRALTEPAYTRAAIQVVEQHPRVRFDMLDPKVQEHVREYVDRTTLWLGKRNGVPAIARLNANDPSQPDIQRGSAGGNAGFVRKEDRYFLATNAHVIQAIDPRPEVTETLTGPLGIDAAFYEISVSIIQELGLRTEDAIDLDESIPGDDNPHGRTVAYGGFDPDDGRKAAHITAGGRKEFLGVAFHIGNLTSSFAVQEILDSEDEIDRQSYAIPLPYKEAFRRDPFNPQEQRPINGVSGGPMFSISKKGDVTWFGNVYAATQTKRARNGKSHDLLLFHTREQFRKAFVPERIFDARPLFE